MPRRSLPLPIRLPQPLNPRQSLAALLLLLVVALVLLFLASANRAGPAASEDGLTLYFSPKGGCTDAIVQRLEQASQSIRVQAYSFTSRPIAQALVQAQQRGIKVTVILDSEQKTTDRTEAGYLKSAHVPVYFDGKHAIAHNKIIILDERTVITGSFNFTYQAENSNAENLLLIEGKPQLAAAYLRNFNQHLDHSEK